MEGAVSNSNNITHYGPWLGFPPYNLITHPPPSIRVGQFSGCEPSKPSPVPRNHLLYGVIINRSRPTVE